MAQEAFERGFHGTLEKVRGICPEYDLDFDSLADTLKYSINEMATSKTWTRTLKNLE